MTPTQIIATAVAALSSWRKRTGAAEAALAEAQRERDEAREALLQAIQVIEWCGLNDKTPPYEYGKGKRAQRRDGSLPGPGKAFNTPREFASWWPDRLRKVLGGAVLAASGSGEPGE